ncbi:MAG TPA: malto-oligosyltrehalose synthase [Acidimicrobiales bacterium]|nr:malto-oligosyltrehalose synthase [Acidimicrobiales bacterium]
MTRRATYRVQLRREFGFEAAAARIPYLAELGISDLYCSPILQAVPGSTHGYDVVDHSRLSTDLGGEPAFRRLVQVLGDRDIGVTVDIVPNHMAIDGRANRWWWDVLENGPSSLYASYFDIDWPGDSSRHEPTVLVPVLGDRYGRVLEAHEMKVSRDGGTFSVWYFDHELPLSPRTVDTLLGRAGEAAGSEPLKALAADFAALPHAALADPATARRRHEEKERLRDRLASLLHEEPDLARAVDAEIEALNRDPDEMDRLLCRQNFRLAYWRTAREELDYRRFFNIETLVGLRVEDDRVFADTHQAIAPLVRDGSVTGLRVDHVDGLRNPEGYLQRLRRLAPGAYVVVEKILDSGEKLPAGWPVEGTTGYDFLSRVANVLVDQSGEDLLTSCYTRLTNEPAVYSEVVRASKLQIMTEELAPEVDRLSRLLHAVCEGHRRQRDRTRGEVQEALRAVLASFPVYRTYVQPDRPGSEADAAHVTEAVRAAKEMAPGTDADLIEFIGELLLLEHPGGLEAEFAQTFPQLSAPVMAKGAEDTAFYRYNRLVSLNEVGGNPGLFGRPLSDFHADTADAARHHPLGMLTLATHDTKRSPDVRARISLLSELPDYWEEAAARWFAITDHFAGDHGPDYNARYLFFQTLVGAWPIQADRLVAYMDKAAKEAKVHTSWADGNPDYDYQLRKFIEATVADEQFVRDLQGFMARQRIVELGRATSLSQQTLLLTCPGVPDVYQGTETWDNSLVDPDNRRPVDYNRLAADLAATASWPADRLATRYDQAADERAKIWLTARLLQHRQARPELYESAPYEPLEVVGDKSSHLIAFSRGRLVVLVGRHLWKLGGDWADTTVELPPGRWEPVIGGRAQAGGGPSRVGDFLGHGPVAVLES